MRRPMPSPRISSCTHIRLISPISRSLTLSGAAADRSAPETGDVKYAGRRGQLFGVGGDALGGVESGIEAPSQFPEIFFKAPACRRAV